MMKTRLHAQPKAAPTQSFTPVRGSVLQRKCGCDGSPGAEPECKECSRQNHSLRRSSRNLELETRNSEGVPPIVHDVLRSPGQPLDSHTQTSMEPRFGHTFSKVQVGTNLTGPGSGQWPSLDQGESRWLSADAHTDRSTERLRLDAGAMGRIGNIGQGPIDADTSSTDPASSASSAPTTGYASDSSCSFSVKYENRKDIKCHEIEGYEGQVGVAAVYDITGVTATGNGCPWTLEGLHLLETISSDGGCSGATYIPTEAEGCPITADPADPKKGRLGKECRDFYAICGPLAAFPEGECTEQYTQETYVGLLPAETRKITFQIFNDGTSVFGLISRA